MSEGKYLIHDGEQKPQKSYKLLAVIGWVCLTILVIVFGIVEVAHFVHQVKVEKALIGLPEKYAVDNVTPRTFQGDKGTCWAHAAVGLLEHSYRNYGIKKGYLSKNEYLRLSIQAFGDDIVENCNAHPEVCSGMGSGPLQTNDTTGGEVEWMYYLSDMEKG
ncbi:MAG: hypothetical protein EZS28_027561, partial [Streblomastix strix]